MLTSDVHVNVLNVANLLVLVMSPNTVNSNISPDEIMMSINMKQLPYKILI